MPSPREQSELNARLRAALEFLPDRFYLLDGVTDGSGQIVDFSIRDANPTAIEVMGRGKALLGALLSAVSPPEVAGALFDKYRHVAQSKEASDLVTAVPTASAVTWKRQQLLPCPPHGLVILAQDITREHESAAASANLAAIVQSSNDAIISETLDGIITTWNAAAERIFGYSAQEVVGKHIAILLPPGGVDDHRERLLSSGGSANYEGVRQRKDGSTIVVDVSATLIHDAAGRPVFASKILRDVTEQKAAQAAAQQAETRLRTSERQFASAFENAPIGMALVAPDGKWLKVNRALTQIVGYSTEEMLTKTFQDITHPDDLAKDVNLAERMLAGELHSYEMTKRYIHRDGRVIWVQLSVSLVRNDHGAPQHFVSQIQDISERRRMEQDLRASLKEKEILLQEVHHRVKNNLQVIASLLNMQIRRLDNAVAITALNECKARIIAIALIHEQLYRSQDYAEVPFADYLRTLATSVHRTTGGADRNIGLQLQLAETWLAVDKAIPCGLIITELITNAFKHAFPDGRAGFVLVELSSTREQTTVSVSNNGIPLPDDFALDAGKTLGMQLVQTLSKQLNASLQIERAPHTRFQLSFNTGPGKDA